MSAIMNNVIEIMFLTSTKKILRSLLNLCDKASFVRVVDSCLCLSCVKEASLMVAKGNTGKIFAA